MYLFKNQYYSDWHLHCVSYLNHLLWYFNLAPQSKCTKIHTLNYIMESNLHFAPTIMFLFNGRKEGNNRDREGRRASGLQFLRQPPQLRFPFKGRKPCTAFVILTVTKPSWWNASLTWGPYLTQMSHLWALPEWQRRDSLLHMAVTFQHAVETLAPPLVACSSPLLPLQAAS